MRAVKKANRRGRQSARNAHRSPHRNKLIFLLAAALCAALLYLFLSVNMKYFRFAMSLRAPKLAVMLVTAFCIGSASIVFQSIINNTIVTPCLLGMNSLYALIHTWPSRWTWRSWAWPPR